jgi:hypothetical protein
MAINTTLVGAWIMATALQRFRGVCNRLLRGGQLRAGQEAVARAIRRAHQRRANRAPYMLFFGTAAVLTWLIFLKTNDPAYTGWWGHRTHGSAGGWFAIVAGLMVFLGASATYVLTVGLRLISDLFRHPVVLRPLHADRCNGFGVFGDFLILLFFLSVTVAAAVLITFVGGYVGIESFAATWLVGASVMLMIPLILIEPLVRCTSQIRRAKEKRLRRIDNVLDIWLRSLESNVTKQSNPEELKARLEYLLQTRRTVTAVYGAYNFPFKPRIVGALSLTYVLQVAVLAREAFGRFS